MEKIKKLKQLLIAWLACVSYRQRHYCPLCDRSVGRFLPYSNGDVSPPLMHALKTVGSDIKNFTCPRCGCHDRERHLYLYLKQLGLFEKMRNAKVLHFAPESQLRKRITDVEPELYVKADLWPTSSDIIAVDIMATGYDDKSFDFVIANHVLEHVENYEIALKEISRVLKVGGYAILQTPYSKALNKTFSDSGINTDTARLHAYGQADHVRLFGNNIFDIFSSYDLKSLVTSHSDALQNISPSRYGVNVEEPLFLFQRIS